MVRHLPYVKLLNGNIRCLLCNNERKSRNNFGRHMKTKECQAAKLRSLVGLQVSTTSGTAIRQQVSNATRPRANIQAAVNIARANNRAGGNSAAPRSYNQAAINASTGNQADINATLQTQIKNHLRDLLKQQQEKIQRELQKFKNDMKRQKDHQVLIQQHQKKSDDKIKQLAQGQEKNQGELQKLNNDMKFQREQQVSIQQHQKKADNEIKQLAQGQKELQQICHTVNGIDQKLDCILYNPDAVRQVPECPTLFPQKQTQLKSSGSSVAGPNNATSFNAARNKDASGASCSEIVSANIKVEMNEDRKGLGQKRSSSETNEGRRDQPSPKRMREDTNSDRMIECITID